MSRLNPASNFIGRRDDVNDVTCSQLSGKIIPVVDLSRREAKGACIVVCPHDLLEIRKIEPSDFANMGLVAKFKSRVHGGNIVYVSNAYQCPACRQCAKRCPERAIKLVRAKP